MEPIKLGELRDGMWGKPYNALIRYHIRRQKPEELAMAIQGTKELLPPVMIGSLEKFSDRWKSRAYVADFWREDCAKVLDEVTSDARDMLHKAGLTEEDETLFNLFQLVTLSLALAASVQPELRKFAGIK